jgi:hypothetical protein
VSETYYKPYMLPYKQTAALSSDEQALYYDDGDFPGFLLSELRLLRRGFTVTVDDYEWRKEMFDFERENDGGNLVYDKTDKFLKLLGEKTEPRYRNKTVAELAKEGVTIDVENGLARHPSGKPVELAAYNHPISEDTLNDGLWDGKNAFIYKGILYQPWMFTTEPEHMESTVTDDAMDELVAACEEMGLYQDVQDDCECRMKKFNFISHERWCPDYRTMAQMAEEYEVEHTDYQTYETLGDQRARLERQIQEHHEKFAKEQLLPRREKSVAQMLIDRYD